ncbi:molybdenum cofactor guanylyltransferase [soil metagenome]|jgi:molybdopterin-guanine dinucleotide biosynthesis protein A
MNGTAKQEISAAVLAGGQSRRMGTDKALLQLGGVPLLARAIHAISAVSNDVFVIGDRPAYHGFGVSVVADAFPDTGTLGGIATALRNAKRDYVLVVACDMPLLNVDLLQSLVNERRDYDALVPVLARERSQQGGKQTFETLHAIYAKSCLPFIEARIRQEKYKVVGFLEDVTVRTVDEAWLRNVDPELLSFVNTNDRAELDRASAHIRTSQGSAIQGDTLS